MTSSNSNKETTNLLGIKTNLDASEWSGSFDCSGPCERKRLPACEFSKSQLKKRRGNDCAAKIVCLKCVVSTTTDDDDDDCDLSERVEERVKMDSNDNACDDAYGVLHQCAKCERELKAEFFAKSQLRNKGIGKQKCSSCAREADALANPKKDDVLERLADARERSRVAEKTNAVDKLKIFAEEAALEAEAVTGLKPKVIGGRGRGRGRR